MRANRTRARHAAVLSTVSLSAVALIVVALNRVTLAAGGASPQVRGVTGATGAVRLTSAGPARGVDVSAFQHPGGAAINWRSVAGAGYRFAFLKASEGSYYINPYSNPPAAAAKAAGLLVAAYHFANPADSSGTVQADYALNHGAYQVDGRTLRMILDIEVDPYLTQVCYGLSPAQMVSWIAAFMDEVDRRTGLRPVINTQPAWWDKCTGSTRAFVADQLWVQDHTAGARSPRLPAGWTGWAYWQYSITGRVPGVSGNTDLSELNPALLAVANPGDQSYQAGRAVSVPVRSVNGAAGQALGFTATGLPAGLSVNPASGVISGTLPGTPASTAVTVKVSATGASPVTEIFNWHVHGKVRLTVPAAQSGRTGGQARLQVAAADGLAGCTLRFTAAGLPPGLSLSTCGLITGRLAKTGAFRPVIRVTDSSAAALASVSFAWKVAP